MLQLVVKMLEVDQNVTYFEVEHNVAKFYIKLQLILIHIHVWMSVIHSWAFVFPACLIAVYWDFGDK